MTKISVLDILEDTTVDGPGFRTAIYAAGCIHNCPGCHNPQSWAKANGKMISIDDIMSTIKKSEFSNVTFTGGDPLMQSEAFSELAYRIRKETSKTIWCYTGYKYEQITTSSKLSSILPFIDVLVDGRYIESLRNESLRFAGSTNQRIINVPASLTSGHIVHWENESSMKLDYVTFNPIVSKQSVYL